MTKELLEYYSGDELSASVWQGKYALKNGEGEYVEDTPHDMHVRMANEFARNEYRYVSSDRKKLDSGAELSAFGRELVTELNKLTEKQISTYYLRYMEKFKHIIPQGSIMSALGNFYKLQSLSNCFVVPAPLDSYGGIFKTDQEIAQLEKRRGGVGTNLNLLAPEGRPVLNAAGTSTGAHSFMDRFSNTTREVAQNGRRGALMLLMSVLHPDIYKFVEKKKDRSKVTGANVSSQLTNKFMEAVERDADFFCRFPITTELKIEDPELYEYNQLTKIPYGIEGKNIYIMKIRAKELFDLIVEMAWDNAEPGVAFMDTVKDWSPEGVYAAFEAIASNPCGEQWMQAYDACRLLAANLYNMVLNPFTKYAFVDYERVYEVFYIQQRLADSIVDLEIEYVDNIIAKIKKDPEPDEVKATELNLWEKVKATATASRRTGCGFTALADMIAALGYAYDSELSIATIKKVMQTKMRAELDCTIDLAITRGAFEGWDSGSEFYMDDDHNLRGHNDFYEMLADEFPEQSWRMKLYGRRNINWSTVAPTGSVSIVAILNKYSNTSGGLEPVFMPFYFRNKKINPSDKGARVDFVDQNGDSWMTFPVMMGGFKEWLEAYWDDNSMEHIPFEDISKDDLQSYYEISPYFGSCAADISWEKRIEIQAVLQRYTTNAISSTLNLPKDVSKSTVAGIYLEAWKKGLKGVTIYRDGCRTGVLVADTKQEDEGIIYRDAPKRPKELEAELTTVTVKGVKYDIIVGFLNKKPYEVFAFQDNKRAVVSKGKLLKSKKGVYDYLSNMGEVLQGVQNYAINADEQMLTRLVSGMMRHGVNPKFIYEQINKCPLEIVSFGKALNRVIKKYLTEEELTSGQTCKDCGSSNVRLQEGCLTCNECGSSKCG